MAGRGRAQGAACRIRHHLCVCGYGVSSIRVSAAGVQPPHRRLRRLDRKSCAPRAAADRSDPRSGGRPCGGGAAHQPRGAARQAGTTRGVRGARGRDAARGLAGSLGRQDGLESHGLRAVALLSGGESRAGDRLRQAFDLASGGRSRALHIARHHGLADQARHSRPHRRCARLHCGSVPAQQNPRGPRAGHPRVHRLQHLHLELA